MGVIRAQVEFEVDSGLPEDRIVNTWHFTNGAGGTVPDNFDDVHAALVDFYTGVGAAGSVTSVLGEWLSGVWRIKQYDLSEPEPRPPVRNVSPAAITPGGGSPLPAEVAICLSYRAAPQPGAIAARRRGRVYIGPLGTVALGTAGALNRVAPVMRDRIAQAATRLATRTGDSARWCVYSPTTDPIVQSGSIPPLVVAGHVDDAFDIQRRRGLAPLNRTTFTA